MRRHHDTGSNNEGKVQINVCQIDSTSHKSAIFSIFSVNLTAFIRFALGISVLPQNVV